MTKLHFFIIFAIFCFLIFLGVQNTWENIAKSAENANLPGIPTNPVAYQPRGSLCYKMLIFCSSAASWLPGRALAVPQIQEAVGGGGGVLYRLHCFVVNHHLNRPPAGCRRPQIFDVSGFSGFSARFPGFSWSGRARAARGTYFPAPESIFHARESDV